MKKRRGQRDDRWEHYRNREVSEYGKLTRIGELDGMKHKILLSEIDVYEL